MLATAFDTMITGASTGEETWYVVLMQKVPFYGGPEEGGWWGADHIVVKYKEFPSEELARKAADRVEDLAKELSAESQKQYGEYCLATWDDPSEPDGPTEYYITCTTSPENTYGTRHYE